jgi:hypothetical protein
MANAKTSNKENTAAQKAAEKKGRAILAQHKELKEVYVTTNGTAFASKNDAVNHARTLKDQTVFTITAESESTASESKSAPAESKESNETTESKESTETTDKTE